MEQVTLNVYFSATKQSFSHNLTTFWWVFCGLTNHIRLVDSTHTFPRCWLVESKETRQKSGTAVPRASFLTWGQETPCTRPEEFWKGGFTLKTHQMFSVHARPWEFKNATATGHFNFVLCLEKPQAEKSHDYREVIVWKSSVFMFSVHTKTKSRCFQFPPVWTVFSKSSVFVTD